MNLICILNYVKHEIWFALSFNFVVAYISFVGMQFDQSENFLTDGMQVNLQVRSSKYRLLWNVLMMDGQIKSKRLKVHFLRDRYTVQSFQI